MTNLYGDEGTLKHFLQDQTTSTLGEGPRQSLQVSHFLIGWLEMIYPIEVYIFFSYY